MRGYQLGLYEKAMPSTINWEEKMMVAKRAGYDYIEISIDETDEKLARLDWSRNERLEFVKLMNKMDMPIRSMCLSGHRKYPIGSPDEKTRLLGINIMEKALQFADDLGIRTIQIAGYDVYYEKSTEESKKIFEENLKKCTLMAARAGIVMGFETMETEFMNTVEKAMWYVKRINSPYLNVYPDLGNITNAAKEYGKDVMQDLATGEGRIIAMHLKETVPGIFREVPYGTGHVDFEQAIEKSYKLGICRFVTEFWYTGEENWNENLNQVCIMMRKKLDKVFI